MCSIRIIYFKPTASNYEVRKATLEYLEPSVKNRKKFFENRKKFFEIFF